MNTIDLETIKKSDDGWKLFSGLTPVFEEKVNCFLRNAANYVNTKEFSVGADNNENKCVNLETYYYATKKFVLSYTSDVKDRDLDCQYRESRTIEFTLDDYGNVIINEMSGRLESKYGYNFENTNGGVFKTDYAYQVYTKEGIELLFRGYSDQVNVDKDKFYSYDINLKSCVKGGHNPRLAIPYTGISTDLIWGKRSRFTELSRSIDNLGLVKETIYAGTNPVNGAGKTEYHLNTFMTTKHDVNPYLIHINRGVMPLAYVNDEGMLEVNYQECGVTVDNFQDLAKFKFKTGAEEKMRELQSELDELPEDDLERRAIINDLMEKYNTLSQMYETKEKGAK